VKIGASYGKKYSGPFPPSLHLIGWKKSGALLYVHTHSGAAMWKLLWSACHVRNSLLLLLLLFFFLFFIFYFLLWVQKHFGKLPNIKRCNAFGY